MKRATNEDVLNAPENNSLPDRPWLDLAPDWVCEVLSPSTERVLRAEPFEGIELDLRRIWGGPPAPVAPEIG
jgi:Uma2 family endonuclease